MYWITLFGKRYLERRGKGASASGKWDSSTGVHSRRNSLDAHSTAHKQSNFGRRDVIVNQLFDHDHIPSVGRDDST